MGTCFPESTSRLENICTQLKETKQTWLCLCHKNNETNIIFAQIEARSKYFRTKCLLGPAESPVQLKSYFSKYKVNSLLSSVIVFIFLNLTDFGTKTPKLLRDKICIFLKQANDTENDEENSFEGEVRDNVYLLSIW